MDHTTLSKRLNTVAQFVHQTSILADIGSDHAYLPTFLALKGQIKKAIAGELNDGPYLSAKKHVQSAGCEDMIEVRKGNGLSVIQDEEVDTVVIAGMGGRLITDILEAGKEKLTESTRLILQPNVGADSIRLWLTKHQWEIIAEDILEEDGRIYEIVVAEKAPSPVFLTEMELIFGPFLLKKKSKPFLKKWQHELRKWETIYASLTHAAETEEASEKKQEFLKKINMVKKVI